jgi:hypothetical protein
MTLDKNSIDMLLKLDDSHLSSVIKKLAQDAGIPTQALNLGKAELDGIRSALALASDGDISMAAQLIEKFKNGKKS